MQSLTHRLSSVAPAAPGGGAPHVTHAVPRRRPDLRSSGPQTRSRPDLVVVAAGPESGARGEATQLPLPRGPAETVAQASAACERALGAGIKRQRVQILIPLVGATAIDDWPGGIRQQFKAAEPMVSQLLRQLRKLPELDGPLKAAILDDADAVGAWSGPKLSAVLFPTAETLGDIRKIADGCKDGLMLLVNPQWTTEGQVISDFGPFPWVRKAAEEFIGGFTETYTLAQLRINGDDVFLIYSYGRGWQVNVASGMTSQTEVILQQDTRPSYKEIEALLRTLPWTMSSKPLLERVQSEAAFIQRTLEPPPGRD